MSTILTRRSALAVGAGGLLTGCDALGRNETFLGLLRSAEGANYGLQRALQARTALAHEFRPDERSPIFRSNGTRQPPGDAYARHMATAFADWRLVIDGLVARPQALSMNEVRAMPLRSQITRHDCVEGWSAIAKWTGVPLATLLARAGMRDDAKYVVFHCADIEGTRRYYESIDRVDALHPQTMLAFALNDATLPVMNGAPLRLRVERQLGYKHAKYVERVEAVASLSGVYGGKGGHWEDVAGYEWYAGL